MKLKTTSEIGCLIRKIRESKGLTQKQLGELAGVNRMTISRLEVGDYNPTVKTVFDLAEALDIDCSIVFDRVK